jgi:transcriptional antiterminator Rof (Rho-off)
MIRPLKRNYKYEYVLLDVSGRSDILRFDQMYSYKDLSMSSTPTASQ